MAYGLVRLLSTIALPPVTTPDSTWYLAFDVSGRGRLWTVPAFFSLFPNDSWRIAGQALVAGAAWMFATWAVSRRSWAAAACVFAVGSMPFVTYWDRVIYSESLSLSLMMTAFGGCVRYRTTHRSGWLAVTAASTGLWVLARPANIALGLLFCVLLVVGAAAERRWAPALASAAVLIVVCLASFLASRNTYGVAVASPVVRSQISADTTDTQTPNLAGVFAQRVHVDPGVFSWFSRYGLPPLPPGTNDAFEVPAQRDWIKANGSRVYLRYLISQPLYTLAGPSAVDVAQILTPADYRGSNLLDQRAPVLSIPAWVAGPVWSNGALGLVVFVVLMVVASWRRYLFGLAMLAMVWASVLVTWHGSTAEYARLGVQGAVLARLAVALIAVDPIAQVFRKRAVRATGRSTVLSDAPGSSIDAAADLTVAAS